MQLLYVWVSHGLVAHTHESESKQECRECTGLIAMTGVWSRQSAGRAWRSVSQGWRSQLKAGNQDSSTRRKSSSRYSCTPKREACENATVA